MGAFFDGAGDFALSGVAYGSHLPRFSVSFWLYMPSAGAPDQFDRIMEVGGIHASQDGVGMEIHSPVTQMRAVMWNGGSAGASLPAATYLQDIWQPVVITSDEVLNAHRWFLGGQQVGATDTTDGARGLANAGTVTLGGVNDTGTSPTQCTIAELALFENLILTPGQIADLAAGVHPNRIRRNAPYWSLAGDFSRKNGADVLTANGQAHITGNHPTMIPRRRRILTINHAEEVSVDIRQQTNVPWGDGV